MAEIVKMDLTSMDIKGHQIEKLKELFPEAFTEGNKIDWDRLRRTLGEQIDAGKERYGMNWPGKADCFRTIQQPSIATLVPAREESVDFDTTQNLFIEGDNLEALKLLQKSYLGKVKMIYIDPPYNTGKDFIYPDNYTENLDTYLAYTGQVDAEGRKFATNTETDGRFHSKWLNMMYPRLFLAKNLLREDGVIFISIDDNEVSNLRKVCDEVFGEENFVGQLVWKKRSSPDARTIIGCVHDYIFCYVKNVANSVNAISKMELSEERKSAFVNYDNDLRGVWSSVDMTGQTGRAPKSQYYDITLPSGRVIGPPEGRAWGVSLQTFNEMRSDNRIWFGKDGNSVPRMKRFLSESEGQVVPSFWDMSDVGSNDEANKDIRHVFEEVNIFDNPKPIRLLKRILEISTSAAPRETSSNSDIILDFFSGSATTAHAVLDLNKQDNGNRKFILAQLPEPCAEDSEAHKAGYKTIADIGKERIRRVIKKVKGEHSEKTDMFKGDISKLDLGFKVFKLSKSNFNIWDANVEKTPEAIGRQLELHISHISAEASQEAILYELLLKSGFELTTPIEKLSLEGKTVYSIAEGELLICLEKHLTNEAIKAMAEKKPSRAICLDEGFQDNDQLKTNAVQIMKSKDVVFRTV